MKTNEWTKDYRIGDILYLSPNKEAKAKYIGEYNDIHCFMPIDNNIVYDICTNEEAEEWNIPIGSIGFDNRPYGQRAIKLSKKEKVLRYMLSGKSITQMQAIDMFNSYRLADLIYKYKNDGYEIETQMKRSNDANYAEYKIVMNDFANEQANKRGINN